MPENEKDKKETEKYPFGVEIEFNRNIVTIEEKEEFVTIEVVDKKTGKLIDLRNYFN